MRTYSVSFVGFEAVNLTLSVNKEVAERARAAARSMGMSLNQAVRSYLEELAGGTATDEEIDEIIRLSEHSRGRSRGWRFNREEIHERS